MSSDKTCSKCNDLKPIEEFHFRNDSNTHYTYCRDCKTKQTYTNSIQKKFNMSPTDYINLHDYQKGLCAICSTPVENVFTGFKGIKQAIDHCHHTGEIRGILCRKCNSGIGMLQDDPYIIEKALNYLNKGICNDK